MLHLGDVPRRAGSARSITARSANLPSATIAPPVTNHASEGCTWHFLRLSLRRNFVGRDDAAHGRTTFRWRDRLNSDPKLTSRMEAICRATAAKHLIGRETHKPRPEYEGEHQRSTAECASLTQQLSTLERNADALRKSRLRAAAALPRHKTGIVEGNGCVVKQLLLHPPRGPCRR